VPSVALADGGMIPVSETLVYEPGQKAIIGWNGIQEILILSTDVYADSDTVVLRIIPLPSQPAIQQGSFDSFVRIGELLDEHFARRYHWWDCPGGMEEGTTGVEIVFHEKIGAHDIWVVKAHDAGEFVKWTDDFLVQNEIDHTISSPELESLAVHYIEHNIDFFVFDLMELGSKARSVEPIVYEFQTDFLYYPLTISSIIAGETYIRLFLLTPQPLDLGDSSESHFGVMHIAHAHGDPIQCRLSEEEITSINSQLSELLGGDAWLTALESYDRRHGSWVPTSLLDEDLKITEASFTEPPESGTPIWGWTVLGLVVLALGGLLYYRYRRGAQLRRMEKEYRKRAWERMQQR